MLIERNDSYNEFPKAPPPKTKKHKILLLLTFTTFLYVLSSLFCDFTNFNNLLQIKAFYYKIFCMEGKRPSESETVMALEMNPEHANPAGNVHGGVIMKLIDTAAGVVAKRHARANVVTASIDRLDFLSPVYVGDLVTLKAKINFVGKTSMEIGVRVESENPITGVKRHTATAYLTFVALDENGKPKEVPPLILETEDDKRRFLEAQKRREMRLAEKEREKKP